MTRLLPALVQLAIVCVSAAVANLLCTRVIIVPALLATKSTALSVTELIHLTSILAGFTSVSAVGSITFTQHLNRGSLRRFVVDMLWLFSGVSVASSVVFVFTVIPFNTNFYAWLYAVIACLTLVAFIIVRRRSSVRRDDVLSTARDLLSVTTAAALLAIMLPGFLAVLYKRSSDFANLVNRTRAEVNFNASTAWRLEDAFPGHLFEQPMFLQFHPLQPETFFVLSRTGRLTRITQAGGWSEEVVLDIADEVGSIAVELGAQGFALHPDFGSGRSVHSGHVFLYYTRTNGGRQRNVLTRYDVTLPALGERVASGVDLVDFERPSTSGHNGGTVLFDQRGFLYFSVGDFGCSLDLVAECAGVNMTQRLDHTFSSGIFRLDPDERGGEISVPITRMPTDGITQNYFIPRDNPFVGEDGVLEEYFALGLRNPFRMSLDVDTGDLWVGDVGHDAIEEHNRIRPGDNGQWDYREGLEITGYSRPGRVLGRELEPFYTYPQTALDRAAVGGFIYRGARHPELSGLYIFADNNSSVVRSLAPSDPYNTVDYLAKGPLLGQQGITSLIQAPDGRVLTTLLGSQGRPNGRIMTLAPEPNQGQAMGSGAFPPSLESVRAKYEMVCSRCHGLDGRGLSGIPELGAAETPDFTSADWQSQTTNDDIRRIIQVGGVSTDVSSKMPGWEGFLSDDETDIMIQLLRSLAQ